MELWTALAIGIGGSLHCIGMCGPIVLALPDTGETKLSIFTGRIVYNFGRVISYMILGALFGLLGNKIVMAGLQQAASISLGVAIILGLILPQSIKNFFVNLAPIRIVTDFIKKGFRKLTHKTSNTNMLLIGILNGFLPCGFVYIGAFGAVATGSVLSGILYMMFFGIGTIPVMLATAIAGNLISLNVRRKMTKAIPVFAFVLAVVFVLRGLELGIPYLSPKLQKMASVPVEKVEEAKKASCCATKEN